MAERLETAYSKQTKILALEIRDRETILVALEETPEQFPELAELCGVLLRELRWLRQEGLA